MFFLKYHQARLDKNTVTYTREVVYELAVSIQPAPARDFWLLESRCRHFPNLP